MSVLKVEGVDVALLQRVQARAEQAVLIETHQAAIRTEQQQQQERRSGAESFEEQLNDAVGRLNETCDLFKIRLRFMVDQETGESYVLVIDREKQEIIRRVPPDKVLSMSYQLEYMVGMMLDELV